MAGGCSYDLGAVFAFNPQGAPFPVSPPPLYRESERIGLCADGAVRYSATVMQCIRQL
jgi:hypothetical protein